MSVIVRECCNYCMWLGPVNADGTMRKHRPATLEDKYGHPNKVQDMGADPCPGSNKPFATFGCTTVPDPRATEQETEAVIDIETIPATGCRAHHVADKRGTHTEALLVTCCALGTTYGVWDDLAGGFTYAVDCAMDAANWAAEQLETGDPDDYEMTVVAVCREHAEQPAECCEECNEEGCGAVDASDMDACGDCADCSSN